MKGFNELLTETIAEMFMKAMIKMMWVNTVQNCFAVGCATALAIIFHKWWLIFIAVLFWRNINPVKMLAETGEDKKKPKKRGE